MVKTEVTDVGLKELRELKNLQTLVLDHGKITNAGLKELGDFASLKELGLKSTRITDAGLKELRQLRSLMALDRLQITTYQRRRGQRVMPRNILPLLGNGLV